MHLKGELDMAANKKLGALIKEARTGANLTQEKLAAKIAGVSANDISRMERGELVPTQDVLKKIAKITGVTQTSLIEASKTGKTASASAKKPAASAKTGSTAKPTAAKTASTSVKLTAEEKKLVEAYRKADSQTKKAAMKVLSGESNSILDTILGAGTSGSLGDAASSVTENIVQGLMNGLLGNLGK